MTAIRYFYNYSSCDSLTSIVLTTHDCDTFTLNLLTLYYDNFRYDPSSAAKISIDSTATSASILDGIQPPKLH